MRVSGVDPKDVEWELDEPVYRVYMWHRPDRPPNLAADIGIGLQCDEYRITEAANVYEVMAWAEANVPALDTFTLYAEVRGRRALDEGPGLLRLAGPAEPNSAGT